MRKLIWLLIAGSFVACSGNDFELSFECGPSNPSACPENQTCPTVPLSNTSCGSLPNVFNQGEIVVKDAKPLGCVANMPFGNPHKNNMQEQCFCSQIHMKLPDGGVGSGPAEWQCTP